MPLRLPLQPGFIFRPTDDWSRFDVVLNGGTCGYAGRKAGFKLRPLRGCESRLWSSLQPPGSFFRRLRPPAAGLDMEPCDMRRGCGRVKALDEYGIGADPPGDLFGLCRWRSDRAKIRCWDRDRWAPWAKRLEAGSYAFPCEATGRKQINEAELSALLEALDVIGFDSIT